VSECILEFRIDIGLIENEGFSKQKLMKCTDYEKEIRRIASVDYIKLVPRENF
jgi:hypothetical protein